MAKLVVADGLRTNDGRVVPCENCPLEGEKLARLFIGAAEAALWELSPDSPAGKFVEVIRIVFEDMRGQAEARLPHRLTDITLEAMLNVPGTPKVVVVLCRINREHLEGLDAALFVKAWILQGVGDSLFGLHQYQDEVATSLWSAIADLRRATPPAVGRRPGASTEGTPKR